MLPDSTYVEVMAQLAYVYVNVFDSAAADSARAVVLETFGVTFDQLRAYSERHGADPDKMLEVYQAISTRAESLAVAADSLSRARVQELLAPEARDSSARADSIGGRLRAPRDSGGGPLP